MMGGPMTQDTIVVFTGKGLTTILSTGGSEGWKLDPQRARKCAYLVCTQNRHGREPRNAEAPHGAAFLAGKISGVEPVLGEDGRWPVRISEYAPLEKSNVWDGGHNPVRYAELQNLGIDPATLDFRPIPQSFKMKGEPAEMRNMASINDVRPLSLAEAKQGLAAHFGVSVNSIEITIRG
jgi:hypothetical protein